MCQSRNFHYSRNCSFLTSDADQKKKDTTFYMDIKDKRYTACPKSTIDYQLFNDAMECYQAYSSGFLYEQGTLANQTEFFIKSSQIIKNTIQEIEADSIKAATKSDK